MTHSPAHDAEFDPHGRVRPLAGAGLKAVVVLSLAFSTYQLLIAAFHPLSSLVTRSLHVGFLLLLIFLIYPATHAGARHGRIVWSDWLLAFAAFALVAALLACLGLFGLSLSTAERRIKEIGVRKAMGADRGDVLRLLLWQFCQPVLLANLLAWPAAWWLMRRWLAEFPYHVELQWWVFVLGSAAVVIVALVTVTGQALAAARAKPVLALRYE